MSASPSPSMCCPAGANGFARSHGADPDRARYAFSAALASLSGRLMEGDRTASEQRGSVALQILFHAQLSCGAGGRHVPHGAEDRTLRPWPIVASKHPENPAVGIRIASVERVLVVDLDHH